MRKTYWVALGGLAVALTAACSRHTMQTAATPNDAVSGFRTFALLPVPRAEDGAPRNSCYDMMAEKSIAHKGIEKAVRWELERRGYAIDERNPDFLVAVYGTMQDSLDLTNWNFGYQPWTNWDPRTPQMAPRVYGPGTVVLDVVSAAKSDRRLLWRGSGVAEMGDDPVVNAYAMQRIAEAIVKRLPKASGRTMAAQPLVTQVATADCQP